MARDLLFTCDRCGTTEQYHDYANAREDGWEELNEYDRNHRDGPVDLCPPCADEPDDFLELAN